jgi:hypothetical protein
LIELLKNSEQVNDEKNVWTGSKLHKNQTKESLEIETKFFL